MSARDNRTGARDLVALRLGVGEGIVSIGDVFFVARLLGFHPVQIRLRECYLGLVFDFLERRQVGGKRNLRGGGVVLGMGLVARRLGTSALLARFGGVHSAEILGVGASEAAF